jgi:hypothetical protein
VLPYQMLLLFRIDLEFALSLGRNYRCHCTCKLPELMTTREDRHIKSNCRRKRNHRCRRKINHRWIIKNTSHDSTKQDDWWLVLTRKCFHNSLTTTWELFISMERKHKSVTIRTAERCKRMHRATNIHVVPNYWSPCPTNSGCISLTFTTKNKG